MIISRTPCRISIAGGGTDLPSYYKKFGSFFISGAINKYIYIIAFRRPEYYPEIYLRYSKVEIVDSPRKLKHDLAREALRLLGISKAIEVTSIADVKAETGLGSSSSYTVGLLHALHAYKRENIPIQTLAEEACKLEIELLKRPIGKQDQYTAAFGGINCYEIDKNGYVTVEPLRISYHIANELEQNLLMFFTGIQRDAAKVLVHQSELTRKNDKDMIENLHYVKELAGYMRQILEKGQLKKFGELIHEHWLMKKKRQGKISSDAAKKIDRWYTIARENGAIGGKIVGAGGGGFFIFYCEKGKDNLRKVLAKEGLIETPFQFDYEGTKIIANF